MEASTYSLYISEREGKSIIESEKGFAVYYFINNACYVQDIFVKKEFRREKVAAGMLDAITKIAKDKGCNFLYGSVCPSANGSTESLIAALYYGFKLDSSVDNFIAYKKEI